MRLPNYEYAQDTDKKEWLNSINMYVGLPYFGGKSTIGKYLLNNIFNLAVQMKLDKKKADIFIDGFTGGGKIGLSIPQGWFDTIVINDLNYGVYSYYKCCQKDDDYIDLIYMIEAIGKDMMGKDFFHIASYMRSFGLGVDKWGDEKHTVTEEEAINPLSAAALTYWVTSASFNNMTDPKRAIYKLTRTIGTDSQNKEDKVFERANIEKIIRSAYKRIPKLHEKLNNQHYIIENLDYKDLIKKYNGKVYTDLDRGLLEKYYEQEKWNNLNPEKPCNDIKLSDIKYGEQKAETLYLNKNKLWYFDPPYHPYCLSGTDAAPYADTFTVELADEMIGILHGDYEDTYGKLEYFIKSDYDPDEVDNITTEKGKPTLQEVKDLYKKLEHEPFCKVCIGGFDKGAIVSSGEKSVGMEYIWCRGFKEGYKDLEGEPAKD